MSCLWVPSWSSTCGLASTLWYQTGCFGEPPREATAAYRPSCSTRISGTLRSLPDLAPTVVRRMTGRPRRVVPRVPPERSYSSTCSRTHAVGLGSYSPVRGMAPLNTTDAVVGSSRRGGGRLPLVRVAPGEQAAEPAAGPLAVAQGAVGVVALQLLGGHV